MAVYRQIHVSFWQDAFVLELTPEEKYFYLYLMTNSKTSQCGIYELSKRIIETDTGYNRETVDKLVQRFVDYEKILYCNSTKEVIVLNWIKYNSISSPTVRSCILKELKNVKNIDFIRIFKKKCIEYKYPIDTLSIDQGEEEEEEKEKEEEKEYIVPYSEIVDYLNEQTNSNFKHSTRRTKDLIRARWNEGHRLEDFKYVISVKTAEWLNHPKWSKFLRPETLFSNKFEGYLNQKLKGVKKGAGNRESPSKYDELF
jgi:uncharacterized phage protein (TIGR02220 family)